MPSGNNVRMGFDVNIRRSDDQANSRAMQHSAAFQTIALPLD